jgi:hypothetical protein
MTIAIVIIVYDGVVSKIVLLRTVFAAVPQGGVGFLFLTCQNSLSPHLSFQQAIKRKQRTQTPFKTLMYYHSLYTPAFRHAYLR